MCWRLTPVPLAVHLLDFSSFFPPGFLAKEPRDHHRSAGGDQVRRHVGRGGASVGPALSPRSSPAPPRRAVPAVSCQAARRARTAPLRSPAPAAAAAAMYLCRAASQALASRLSRAPSAASRLKQRGTRGAAAEPDPRPGRGQGDAVGGGGRGTGTDAEGDGDARRSRGGGWGGGRAARPLARSVTACEGGSRVRLLGHPRRRLREPAAFRPPPRPGGFPPYPRGAARPWEKRWGRGVAGRCNTPSPPPPPQRAGRPCLRFHPPRKK